MGERFHVREGIVLQRNLKAWVTPEGYQAPEDPSIGARYRVDEIKGNTVRVTWLDGKYAGELCWFTFDELTDEWFIPD